MSDLFNIEGVQSSSPVVETDRLKEIRLERENNTLLEKRNRLLREIEELELKWNSLNNDVSSTESQKEEDELIMDLIKKASQTGGNNDDAPDDPPDELVEFDDFAYSTLPLRDWSIRHEYLRKFYPYIQVLSPHSTLTLHYIDAKPQVLKSLSFVIQHSTLFEFEVAILLRSKDNIYSVYDLKLTKTSNNRFNTLLISIADHFSQTKNINGFLYTLNVCFESITKRHSMFKELYQRYVSDDFESRHSIYNNTVHLPPIQLTWDIVFDPHDGLYSQLTVNSQFNSTFKEMLEFYGLKKSIALLLENIDNVSSP